MTGSEIAEHECKRIFACLEGVAHAGLAVSGGADSMALMHLAHAWRGQEVKRAPDFTVLTVDHGLREDSAGEAQWVARQAQALGLACAVLRWEPGERATRVQEAAREARYALMAAYAHAHGFDALVTAHHLDDQAETLLMRLARGSGLDGLAGIPKAGRWAGLAVVRPLLEVPKTRLMATLRARGAKWLDDPSNDDARFERVRVRQAMKTLETLGIGADALARSATRLRRAYDALDRTAGEFLALHVKLDEAGFGAVDAGAFCDAPDEIVIRVMAGVLQSVGGHAARPRLAKLEALVSALKGGDETDRTLSGCRVAVGPGGILVLREPGRSGFCDMELKPGESGLWDNRFRVSLSRASNAPVTVRALGKQGYAEVRARLGEAVILPDGAAESLVSFWRDQAVLSVPPLGFFTPSGRGNGCAAEFVNRVPALPVR